MQKGKILHQYSKGKKKKTATFFKLYLINTHARVAAMPSYRTKKKKKKPCVIAAEPKLNTWAI